MKLPGVISLRKDLPIWAIPNGGFLRAKLQDVLEVDEDPLGGLGAQVDLVRLVLDGADVGLEHQVELARLRELAAALRAADLALGVLGAELLLAQVVLAPALLALAQALDQRIGEAGEVARRLPDLGVLDDRRVERDDVVALLDHRPPPLGLDVVLEQHAVVAVVVGVGEAAVDLRRREDEAAPLAERDDLVELAAQPWASALTGGSRAVPGGAAHYPLASDADLRVPLQNGHTFEVIQSMSDDPVETCEVCGAPVERVFHPVAVHFKGSGFYSTDYGSKSKAGGRRTATRPPATRRTPRTRGLEAPRVELERRPTSRSRLRARTRALGLDSSSKSS